MGDVLKYALGLTLIGCLHGYGQVGINTTNPQQSLHVAGSSGTVRIESLNSANNSYNGGDANGDLDPTNDTYPLYVDENGDFTLELKTPVNSEEFDAFDDTSLPNSSLYLATTDSDGVISTEITSYSVTVPRASLLEVKYSISFEVYLDATLNPITDNLARRIVNFVRVSGQTRVYGRSSKNYSNSTSAGVNGTMYNSATTYVTLPSAGTYTISIYGGVGSNIKGGGGGTLSKETYIEFAKGNDSVFMRVH